MFDVVCFDLIKLLFCCFERCVFVSGAWGLFGLVAWLIDCELVELGCIVFGS